MSVVMYGYRGRKAYAGREWKGRNPKDAALCLPSEGEILMERTTRIREVGGIGRIPIILIGMAH